MKRSVSRWPVLRSYDSAHLTRIALPLGGIGTGTISLGGRGDLRDWEIVNRPAKGFEPGKVSTLGAVFVLWTRDATGRVVTRALEGAIPEEQYEGSGGCTMPNHGLPRFRDATFDAAYPLGQVRLRDPDVPLTVRLEAFNPLVPGDADTSGVPVAILRYVLHNPTAKPIAASVCGTVTNFIGADGGPAPGTTWTGQPNFAAQTKENRNLTKDSPALRGVFMYSAGIDRHAPQAGTMTLATTARGGVTRRTAWADLSWGDTLLDFWDDFTADGRLDERDRGKVQSPKASVAVRLTVPPRGETSVTFLIAWHFPNRQSWTPAQTEPTAGNCNCGGACGPSPDTVGNYYATQYADAWDVAAKVTPRLAQFEAATVRFVSAFCASDLPAAVKEAALFNLSTLRSQTCFRTADGRFYGWEGCHDRGGCCHGSCTHVWNYEHATGFLFGELARNQRETEYLLATDDHGLQSFRVNLPIARAREFGKAAADGQMGTIMRFYRDWQLSGDDAFLRRCWPKVRKAIEFCWIDGGWDGDQDGVMEGCQHNTMDVEYYGPNPQMEGWYLGALRAGEEMARHLGDAEFADRCADLFRRGRAWTDANLFNGEYYEHQVRVPPKIAPGLQIGMGVFADGEPQLQLGAGCLVDQLVGQYTAHVCGLGYLLKPAHVRRTLASIRKYNFKPSFRGHFNHLRSFVMNDEAGLVMATYPRGRRPERPFPYYNEVMTGFEYAAAIGMLYEGQVAAGLKVIQAIRERYDGHRRSPFDEAECGHHYGRAMASWAAVPALTGFRYSGVTQTLEFARADGPACWFWANGSAWGTCRQVPGRRQVEVELAVRDGKLRLRHFRLRNGGGVTFRRTRTIAPNRTLRLRLSST